MSSVVRFVHASDFRLGEPVVGMDSIPPGWIARLADAPYRAVERVIETALQSEVDFVLLAGDLLDPQHCGAAALAFLYDQFSLLAEQHIPVFWALGRRDHARRWGESMEWPGKVHIFGHDKASRHELRCNGLRVDVLGLSWQADGDAAVIASRTASRPTVFVGYGERHGDDASAADYWALGGRTDSSSRLVAGAQLCFAGTPQPREAVQQSGACRLVTLDDVGRADSKLVETEALRWRREWISVDDCDDTASVIDWIQERTRELADESDLPCLVSWECHGFDPQAIDCRAMLHAARKVPRLKKDHVVTVAVTAPASGHKALEHDDDETILGDFLDALQQACRRGPSWLKWEQAVNAAAWPEPWSQVICSHDESAWQALVDEAAATGRQLLQGDRTRVAD